MPLEQLLKEAVEVFQCKISKMKFWLHDNGVYASFENTKWVHLADKAVYWGKSSKIGAIIEFHQESFNR